MLKQQVYQFLKELSLETDTQDSDSFKEIEFRFRRTPEHQINITSLLDVFIRNNKQLKYVVSSEVTTVFSYSVSKEMDAAEPVPEEEMCWADMGMTTNVSAAVECEEEEYDPESNFTLPMERESEPDVSEAKTERNNEMNLRKIVRQDNRQVTYEEKTAILKHDFVDNFRCSVSIEKKISETHGNRITQSLKPKYIREKQRISHTFLELGLRLDITKINGGDQQQKKYNGTSRTNHFQKQNYNFLEIEVELLDETFRHNLEQISNLVVSIYRVLSVTVTYSKNLHDQSKFVGVKPKCIEVHDVSKILNNHYTVTKKAEGERKLMLYFRNEHALPAYIFLIGTDHILHQSRLRFEIKLRETVLDAEEIVLENGETHYYVFDILWFNGRDLRYGNTLPQRLSYFRSVLQFMHLSEKKFMHLKPFIDITMGNTADTTNGDLMELHRLSLGGIGTQFHIKPAKRLEYIQECTKTDQFKTDGLVFTPIAIDYKDSRMREMLLKWKPPEENTIDFTIRHISKEIWELNYERVAPGARIMWKTYPDELRLHMTTLTPKSLKLFETVPDNSIVEMYFDEKADSFQPLRIRTDKVHANFEKVVYDTWASILNPVQLSMFALDKDVAKRQYDSLAEKQEINSRREQSNYEIKLFHNFVKRSLIQTYGRSATNILDLAAGRGGDMGKFFALDGLRNLVMVDNSSGLLDIAKEREDAHQKKRQSGVETAGKKRKRPTVNVSYKTHDLRSELILSDTAFDMVSCQFALHYFFEDEKTVQNMFGNISRHLRPGGFFIGTCFDGRSVYNHVNSTTMAKQQSQKNYIIPLFSTSTRSAQIKKEYGMKIAVHMEDSMVHAETSDGVPEYLVFFDVLAKIAEQYDLRLIESMSFKNYYGIYKECYERKYWLKPEDQQFSFMNRLFVFQKCKQLNISNVRKGREHVQRKKEDHIESIAVLPALPYFFNRSFKVSPIRMCLTKNENEDYFTRVAYMYKFVLDKNFREACDQKQIERVRSEIKALEYSIRSRNTSRDGITEISDEQIVQHLLDNSGDLETGFLRIQQVTTGKSTRYAYYLTKPTSTASNQCKNYIVIYIVDNQLTYICQQKTQSTLIPSMILKKTLGARGKLNL